VSGPPAGDQVGRQGAVALSPTLLAVVFCLFLPVGRRTFLEEIQREGGATYALLLVFALPLLLGGASLAFAARRREPGRGLTIAASVAVALQALGCGGVFALLLREAHRDSEKLAALIGLVMTASAVVTLARGRKLAPWPRWAHVLSALAISYLPFAAVLFLEVGRQTRPPLGVNLLMLAAGMSLPLVAWITWPPRWRASATSATSATSAPSERTPEGPAEKP
jgi:hypothetical protein